MSLAYIGLGSNLNNPLQQVKSALQALAQLPGSELLQVSRWYRSKAIGPGEQPDFVNGVALLQTTLQPLALLDAMQAIEHAHQRVRDIRWGPRTLDLDLLLYDQQCIDHERLQVPHPWLTRRNFVLWPLADIDPALTLPSGESITSLLADCSMDGLEPLALSAGADRD
ncbi:2-amino-4-hydroxy-6-hydroxymethyldihydropteridine diphosphokinase [Pseudomaricurvus sp. HS19]|uniref:2-amino-4-hydroxy-6- hydroxymethyldihydropteridine diphosphokinase n=1 Tax=Pseudomaricurvus sp. HS19 TaxID=2692626 RepID=UPI001371F528|nr:2-amino-4-hydroxy-6-hydroxymethyldihydropteridine diphosphokinase [Pseudomaricurvus sp. HS19]MYM64320.1 2-amino-4-hydroxy-6-hydroxymethyldihydropteridine diphosphokinase [Pseudomaricurvus sp. HS19]